MNQDPDNYEDHRQNGGAVAWTVIAMLLVGLYLAGFAIDQLIQTDKSPVPTKAVTTERTQSWK